MDCRSWRRSRSYGCAKSRFFQVSGCAMETTYLVCAIVGGTLIACQFLMTLLGLGGGHDFVGHDGGGHDFHMDAHHEAGHDSGHEGHDHGSSWFLGLLTFRTLTAAVAFFGLTGLMTVRANLEPLQSLALSVGAGAAALLLVGWLMRQLGRMNVDGTVRIDRAVGSKGTVYLTIPAGRAGVGKCHVSQQNRTVEYKAVTSLDSLATGAKIVVVAVIGPDTIEVALATDSERPIHA